ncbi:MAG: hypothetical protein LBC61_04370 [Candidatus Peribacteria bacterium]|jgi:hypothetical protein|nr:hypothetical protein [Candidatus Peribacteria bacterium]
MKNTPDKSLSTLLNTPDKSLSTLLSTPDKPLSTLLNTPDKPLSTLLSTPSNKPLSTLLNIPSTLLMRKEDLPIFILEEVEMIKDMKRGIERKKKSQLALDNIRSHL